MRAFEFLVETQPKTAGRDFNHLEDLVYLDPDQGAIRAVTYLKKLSVNSKNLSIKWDGSPTVFWGRDEDGIFMLLGNNNWGREEGKSTSPDELEKFVLSRGKGEEWRPKFAKDLAALWPVFQAATPKEFRGFIYGDLLYHPGKPFAKTKTHLEFTPNQTTYQVKVDSDIGKRMSQSKIGVAAHMYLENFGDPKTSGTPLTKPDQFSSSDIVVIGQTYVTHQAEIESNEIDRLHVLAAKYQQDIKAFLSPKPGLADLQKIIYTYVNATSQAENLANIDKNFISWLETSKVSLPKQGKIKEMIKSYPGVLENILGLVKSLMIVKDHVIDQLDSAESDITAHTNGKAGGEGYISQQDYIKLVPRHRWRPYRAD